MHSLRVLPEPIDGTAAYAGDGASGVPASPGSPRPWAVRDAKPKTLSRQIPSVPPSAVPYRGCSARHANLCKVWARVRRVVALTVYWPFPAIFAQVAL
ncbi:hypothetical protein AZA_85818 [Nitrospirillum viridazoti Y2]|nr:hypothetical protein AZA_85818 [Nitrospirillum amazonense Y2]